MTGLSFYYASINVENIMKQIVITLIILLGLNVSAHASPLQECMGQAKMFQNPSAMAGAADICMHIHFENLKTAADTCRTEASTKTIPGASYAACQTSLIFDLVGQVDDCEKEAQELLQGEGEVLEAVKQGAITGCESLAENAAAICRDNANKFSGIAQSAALSACEQAGL